MLEAAANVPGVQGMKRIMFLHFPRESPMPEQCLSCPLWLTGAVTQISLTPASPAPLWDPHALTVSTKQRVVCVFFPSRNREVDWHLGCFYLSIWLQFYNIHAMLVLVRSQTVKLFNQYVNGATFREVCCQEIGFQRHESKSKRGRLRRKSVSMQ